MFSIQDIELALATVCLFVSDYLDKHPKQAQWRKSNNKRPHFTDTEVLMIALMQNVLGCQTLKQTYRYIKNNHASAFPHLCSYSRWIARLHPLQSLVGHLLEAALSQAKMPTHAYVVDSKPIPCCKPIRHARALLLREEGATFGKGSTGWYFGYKLHLITHLRGGVVSAMLTPANCSDLDPDVLVTLCSHLNGGLLLGDKGYQGQEFQSWVKEETGMGMLTPSDIPSQGSRRYFHQKRKLIETYLSQLWRLGIDRVYSRSFLGLWNTLLLKILSYNLAFAKVL